MFATHSSKHLRPYKVKSQNLQGYKTLGLPKITFLSLHIHILYYITFMSHFRWSHYSQYNTRIPWYYWSRAGAAVAARWRLSAYRLPCTTSCCHHSAVSRPLRTSIGLPAQHTSVPNETAHCLSHIYYWANKWEAIQSRCHDEYRLLGGLKALSVGLFYIPRCRPYTFGWSQSLQLSTSAAAHVRCHWQAEFQVGW